MGASVRSSLSGCSGLRLRLRLCGVCGCQWCLLVCDSTAMNKKRSRTPTPSAGSPLPGLPANRQYPPLKRWACFIRAYGTAIGYDLRLTGESSQTPESAHGCHTLHRSDKLKVQQERYRWITGHISHLSCYNDILFFGMPQRRISCAIKRRSSAVKCPTACEIV